jgi:hypothetical protein
MLWLDRERVKLLGSILEPKVVLVAFFAVIVTCLPVQSYPEFQTYSEKHSGRTVDCAMCHANPDGPIGNGTGQLGGLSADDIAKVNQARVAMNPGFEVDSPILNKFGDLIVKAVGAKRIIELRSDPSKLPAALGDKSDLDGDGIPDSREYIDGTDPLNKFHGDPALLFLNNFKLYKWHILLAIVAVGFLDYGIINLLKGFSVQSPKSKQPSEPTE